MLNLVTVLYALVGSYQLDSIADLPDSLLDVKIAAYEKIIESSRDSTIKAKAHLTLGDEYLDLKFSDRALEQYKSALDLYKIDQDSVGISQALAKLSTAYSTVQQYHDALRYALLIPDYSTDLEVLKVNSHQIGYVYFNLFLPDSAEKYFRQAIRQYEITDDVPVASLLMLAGLQIDQGKYENALQGMLELEEKGISTGTKTSQYFTYNFISALYKKLGNQRMSRVYLIKRDSLHITEDDVPRPLDFLETNVIADTLSMNFKDAIENQRKYILELKAFYKNDLSTQLANFQKLYELQEKEGKIELLEKENQLYELRQHESKFYLIILVLSVVILFLGLLLAYRMLVLRNKRNNELKVLNERISTQSDALQEKNDLLQHTIKELKGTQSQLIQSEKMASIGSFVSGVAHELNNPINILNGGLQVIERNLGEMEFDDNKHQDLLDDIQIMLKESSFSIAKINRIIQALIIATYTDKTPVEVDFVEIIDNVKIALREESSKGDVKFIQEVESVRFTCFPNRIHHAIKSVLENAFYYARQSSPDEAFVRIALKELEKSLVVTIENSGPAIPEADLLKVFDPFFTTKDDSESPGLGLYFAFSAVKEHRGTISASNADGHVTFTMTFPK
ncbi:ATP-binding protein [Marinoscillum pacificum]|uniref:ATP-binding protein n=1 Tax=Marinoscillum pacificum TaxID=392723 RepID=UPI002157D8D6|nr:ATP-binding protein [Marinoscillum pacificum]